MAFSRPGERRNLGAARSHGTCDGAGHDPLWGGYLAEYFTGYDLRLDEWLFRDPASAGTSAPPGRMAHATALDMILFGVAIWLQTLPATICAWTNGFFATRRAPEPRRRPVAWHMRRRWT